MADKIIEELTRRIEALEKKYYEVNFPYQKPPYPCVVEAVFNKLGKDAYLLSDGQIKITNTYAYDYVSGSMYETTPTTLGRMAERAGVEIAPADMKKKTVILPKIFEKFGGMKFSYMGDFIVSDGGALYEILPVTPQKLLEEFEKEIAEMGESFKRDSSASEWDNIKAAFNAYDVAKKKKS